jgi:hypothetical protein
MNMDAPLGVVNGDVGGRATSVVDSDEVNAVSGRDSTGSDSIGREDDDGVMVETVAGTVEDIVEGSVGAIAATGGEDDGAAAATAKGYDGGGGRRV